MIMAQEEREKHGDMAVVVDGNGCVRELADQVSNYMLRPEGVIDLCLWDMWRGWKSRLLPKKRQG